MKIEMLGYLIIPLGLILACLENKYLLYTILIFIGFTGASIIKIGDLSIQPAYYLGGIFIIKQIIEILKNKRKIKINKFLIIFIIICICSVIMPKIIEGLNIEIINQNGKITNAKFTSHNITQLMYLIYCFIFFVVITDYLNQNKQERKNVINYMIIGAIIVSILGIYQELAYIYKWPFDIIFRSNINGNIQPYGSFVRIYSTTIEPSILAYYLVPMFALITSINDENIKYKYLFLALILLTGFGSTSSTFILGLIITTIILVINAFIQKDIDIKRRNKSILRKFTIVILIGAICLLIIYLINKNIVINIFQGLVQKITRSNLSGQERSSAFINHILVGFRFPLLGIGFGTVRSKDLLSTWICNIGILGTGIFIYYLIDLVKKLRKNKSTISYGTANFIIVVFICAFASVPEPYNLFIWLMLAMGESMVQLEETKENR